MVHNDGDKCENMVRMSVSLPSETYNSLVGLAREYNVSMAFIIRLAVEKRLSDYLGGIRYIDREQADKIHTAAMEILDETRLILNNIRRIGVNYNQELRLKNAEKKYESAIAGKGVGYIVKYEAREEYRKAKSEAEKACLSKEELLDLLARFELAADKLEDLSWLIQE